MPKITSPARWGARLGRIALLAGTVLLLAALATLSGLTEVLELITYDLRFQLRGPRSVDAPIIIVAIDDESFEQLQQNVRSWPRSEYARLIAAIAAGHPAVIGVDIVFDTPGRDPGGDEALAEVLHRWLKLRHPPDWRTSRSTATLPPGACSSNSISSTSGGRPSVSR